MGGTLTYQTSIPDLLLVGVVFIYTKTTSPITCLYPFLLHICLQNAFVLCGRLQTQHKPHREGLLILYSSFVDVGEDGIKMTGVKLFFQMLKEERTVKKEKSDGKSRSRAKQTFKKKIKLNRQEASEETRSIKTVLTKAWDSCSVNFS